MTNSFERRMMRMFSPPMKGGGGGGGSSGTTDFPAYMKTIHGDWLDRNGAVTLAAGQSITELIQSGLTNSPYTGEVAYDPDLDIVAFLAELADFKTDVDAVTPATDWVTYSAAVRSEVDTNIIDETTLAAATTAHGAVLDDRLTSDVLPRFQSGMRDINAVISSSFTIGQSVLEAFNTREVADFDAKLRLQSYGQRNQMIMQGTTDMIKLLELKLRLKESVSRSTTDSYRAKVLMKKEELDEQLDIDDKEYRWGLELYQYGGNILSSISGSALSTTKGPSKMQSALGGAMSGAAAGAMVGGPWGAAAGAVIGGLGSMM